MDNVVTCIPEDGTLETSSNIDIFVDGWVIETEYSSYIIIILREEFRFGKLLQNLAC